MSRVAIVGVEGSGKTVLMATFGEKYIVPDANGVFLEPKEQTTFGVVSSMTADMREGKWPPATAAQSVTSLDWKLRRREGDKLDDLCDISFLDFGGELYRLAFGNHTEEEREPYHEQINALKSHIGGADALVVLLNLKDIINGRMNDSRTLEMQWVTKGIVDYARTRLPSNRILLVFSQYETFRSAVESVGGLQGAYAKYLRHMRGPYPDLPLAAVSAVDRTVLTPEGYEVPAPDFTSSGLDTLMEWIVADVERRRREYAESRRRNEEQKRLERESREREEAETRARKAALRRKVCKWGIIVGLFIPAVFFGSFFLYFRHGRSVIESEMVNRLNSGKPEMYLDTVRLYPSGAPLDTIAYCILKLGVPKKFFEFRQTVFEYIDDSSGDACGTSRQFNVLALRSSNGWGCKGDRSYAAKLYAVAVDRSRCEGPYAYASHNYAWFSALNMMALAKLGVNIDKKYHSIQDYARGIIELLRDAKKEGFAESEHVNDVEIISSKDVYEAVQVYAFSVLNKKVEEVKDSDKDSLGWILWMIGVIEEEALRGKGDLLAAEGAYGLAKKLGHHESDLALRLLKKRQSYDALSSLIFGRQRGERQCPR